jgi:glycosyltransferase involved in cell wall biosynthesis
MSDVISIMKKSDIGIIPHFRSPQNDCSSPNKLFHYMYASLPVIVSNCSSLERIILQNDCGYVFEDKNKFQLAKILDEIIENLEFSKEKGRNGKRAVLDRYNTKKEGENLKKIYWESLVSDKII